MFRQWDPLVVVGWYTPPSLLAEAAYPVDNIIKEPAIPFHNLSHDEGSQLSPFLETDILVVDTIARDLILCKDCPGQHRPWFGSILFAIADITLTHLVGNGVAPKSIIGLRQQARKGQSYRQ